MTDWRIVVGDGVQALRGADWQCDHIITDPPYDQKTHAGARTTKKGRPKSDSEPLIGFDPLDGTDFVADFISASKRWVICFCALEMLGSYRDSAGQAWIRSGVWDRPNGLPQLSGDRPAQGAEGIAIMHQKGRKRWRGGGSRALWRCGVERSERLHPTQKPLGLMIDLVQQFTDPGDLVVDPFCGSGSTGVACVRLGRRFLGYEIDPSFAAMARARLDAATKQTTVKAAEDGQIPMFARAKVLT